MGAKGAVGSTYNFIAPLFNSMIEAFNSGDIESAQNNQMKAFKLVALLKKYRIFVSLKAIMKAIDIDCGPCRSPLRNLSNGEYKNLCTELEQIGFFSFCSKLKS
jgi:N-acetylneuraminate lyase